MTPYIIIVMVLCVLNVGFVIYTNRTVHKRSVVANDRMVAGSVIVAIALFAVQLLFFMSSL